MLAGRDCERVSHLIFVDPRAGSGDGRVLAAGADPRRAPYGGVSAGRDHATRTERYRPKHGNDDGRTTRCRRRPPSFGPGGRVRGGSEEGIVRGGKRINHRARAGRPSSGAVPLAGIAARRTCFLAFSC